jgi:hypothetical protein
VRFSPNPAAAVLLLLLLPTIAIAQYQPPSEHLTVRTDHVTTWNDGEADVVLCDTPVTIETDRATMSAQQAVIWLTPVRGSVLDEKQAQVSLIGDAKLSQPSEQITRSGEQLFVTIQVRGSTRMVIERRTAVNLSDSDLFRAASRMRPLGGGPPEAGALLQRPWIEVPPTTEPTTQPTTRPLPREPVNFRADHVSSVMSAQNRVAFVLSGNVIVYQRRGNGDLIELQADRAVIFTQLRNLRDAGQGGQYGAAEDAVVGAYCEGDVRVGFTPSGAHKPEQRLNAERVYYEFSTDRAVLTQAVVHTVEPERQLPITVRADAVRQLSVGEYQAQDVKLSTSQFATPTYSINASRMYVRQIDTGDPRYGTYTEFTAHDMTFNLFGLPVFWLPVTGGSFTDRGMALRNIYLEGNNRFGVGVRSEWGLFETLGILPPQDLDIAYRLEYFQKRGFAAGLQADYQGGFITETTKEPWDFKGQFKGYFLPDDMGEDKLGRDRRTVEPPETLRGMVIWEHQHFFPQDWQIQLRGGYSSDPTFLEEWFEREFDTGIPNDFTAYAKRQRDTEAMTLLVQLPTNTFPTAANEQQEQVKVERIPEIGYRRIGDSFGDDSFTFFSDNRVGLLDFRNSSTSLVEQGFRPGQSPGIPSYGQTGTDDSNNLRADLRQEVDYPFSAGQFKIVPFVFGRYTGYTDTPDNGARNRFFVGTGLRINTAFWKTDDQAKSELFDIHRMRHVVEPEVNLFTSAQTRDASDFFIYDEDVDALYDVSAVQVALHQRWQTKRGGAGNWRSVDFFTLNVEANFFANKPSELFRNPTGFRGLFFPSIPEASVPRNSVNADALWRVSDTTAILADAQYNLDQYELATTSIGLAIQRDPRISYFVGTRYIGQINSTIASFAMNYELSAKYALLLNLSYSLSERRNQSSSITLVRHFDRLFANVTLYYDAVDDTSGFRFGLTPEGLGPGASTDALSTIFGP